MGRTDTYDREAALSRSEPGFGGDGDMVRLAAAGLMATGVVHDLGNLMQVIASAVRLVERTLDPPAAGSVRPFLQAALSSVDRATILSRQVLGVARQTLGSEEPARLDDVLGVFCEPLTLMLGTSIELDLVLGDNLPRVFCCVREFENVILNLALNARDAMPEGGRLRISANRSRECRVENAGPTMVLRVTDTGRGMSAEQAKHAFAPFYTTKPAGQGTGLGLAMVHDFARRAGGSVEIESVLNLGTSVVLRLPGCEAA